MNLGIRAWYAGFRKRSTRRVPGMLHFLSRLARSSFPLSEVASYYSWALIPPDLLHGAKLHGDSVTTGYLTNYGVLLMNRSFEWDAMGDMSRNARAQPSLRPRYATN